MSGEGTGSSLEVNGASIYYEDRGHGPAIVLIHGGFGAGSEWEPVAAKLAGEYRVRRSRIWRFSTLYSASGLTK